MEDLIDLIATDSAPSDISDKVKELLYTKASERIEAMKPMAAASVFDMEDQNYTEDQEE